MRTFFSDTVTSIGITLGITVAINLVFRWTGFFESHFFRPSTRNFRHQEELGVELEDRFFESKDGTRLRGWFVVATDDAIGTVIHFHRSDLNKWLQGRTPTDD